MLTVNRLMNRWSYSQKAIGRWMPFGASAQDVRGRKSDTIKIVSAAIVWSAFLMLPTDLHAQDLNGGPSAFAHAGALGMPSNVQSEALAPTPQLIPRLMLPSGTLGADDLVEINVPYCPELSRNFRVGADGVLKLPLVRSGIPVSGLTPDETAVKIKAALVSEQVLADPTVIVSVVEYRSRPVSVTGAVVHPLIFQATGETTLLDAITMAGGVTPAVGADILVTSTRRNAAGVLERNVQTIPVQGLLAQSNSAYNLALHGGEEVRVGEAGKVFIAGNVNKPGMYTMQGTGETTVIKALALSQGLQSFSSSKAYIYRSEPDGSRKEIFVPLSRIISRKDPDVILLADDILYIPDNNGKRVSVRVLTGLAGFGQATASGMLIYR